MMKLANVVPKWGLMSAALIAMLIFSGAILHAPVPVAAQQKAVGEIIDYRVVRGTFLGSEFHRKVEEDFVPAVKKHMSEGWKPHGGPSVSAVASGSQGGVVTIVQAMVKRR